MRISNIAISALIGSATIVPAGAQSIPSFAGKICYGWFKNPRTDSEDARGAVIFKFNSAQPPVASVVRKMGRDAQFAPWTGVGQMPQDYRDVGITTPVQNGPPVQFNSSWINQHFHWELKPTSATQYDMSVFPPDKDTPLTTGQLTCN